MRSRVARFALTAGLALCVPSVAGAQAPDAAADDEPAVQRMLIQMKLEHGGETLTHPGHMTETGSEITLVLTQGKKKHEVTVYLEKKGKGFEAEVKYSTGGKVVLEEVTNLEDKTWGSVHKGKTKISLRVDTSARRPDEVDLPDGDNPLDGLK